MDYRKVDPGLATALEEAADPEAPSLAVFIHTARAPDKEAMRILEGLGVAGVTGDQQTITATLSPRAVAQLTEQPWVQSIKLSRKLRPVKNSGE